MSNQIRLLARGLLETRGLLEKWLPEVLPVVVSNALSGLSGLIEWRFACCSVRRSGVLEILELGDWHCVNMQCGNG